MTKEELKEFLFHSMRLKADHMPNYHIKLYFECEELDENELDRFVDRLQNFLSTEGLGGLLMFGIHENFKEGDFIIRCSDIENIRLVFERIKPILNETSFFEFGYAGLVLPTETGGYIKEGEPFGVRTEPRDDDEELNVELPIPEGYEPKKKNAFLSFISRIFSSY